MKCIITLLSLLILFLITCASLKLQISNKISDGKTFAELKLFGCEIYSFELIEQSAYTTFCYINKINLEIDGTYTSYLFTPFGVQGVSRDDAALSSAEATLSQILVEDKPHDFKIKLINLYHNALKRGEKEFDNIFLSEIE